MRSPIASLSDRLQTRRRRVVMLTALLVLCGLGAALALVATAPEPDDSAAPAHGPSTAPPTGDEAAATPTPSASATVDPSDRVASGKQLRRSEAISTSDGSHRLVMQATGDLVLFAGATPIWNTATAGNPGASLHLASDGRLSVSSRDGTEVWSNGVRSEGARLVVKPDGRLYEISTSGEAVWSTRPPSYLASAPPYVNPDSASAAGARAARTQGRTEDAALLDKAANQGSARWLSTADGVDKVAERVRAYAAAAAAVGQTPVFVTYAIPDRDCGSMSAGGFSADVYRSWSAAVAQGLTGTRAVVVVEPDSLLHLYRCGDSDERLALLRESSAAYAGAGAEVYLDAGTGSTFGRAAKQLDDIAARLRAAGVEKVAGFATNVSNFQTTADERSYANKLSGRLGGARYVIDTSRNGRGPLRDAADAWCNPPDRGLGDPPSATLDGPHVANLWIKTVGLSDGTCRGGPAAGRYWEQYLLDLARNASW